MRKKYITLTEIFVCHFSCSALQFMFRNIVVLHLVYILLLLLLLICLIILSCSYSYKGYTSPDDCLPAELLKKGDL